MTERVFKVTAYFITDDGYERSLNVQYTAESELEAIRSGIRFAIGQLRAMPEWLKRLGAFNVVECAFRPIGPDGQYDGNIKRYLCQWKEGHYRTITELVDQDDAPVRLPDNKIALNPLGLPPRVSS